MIFSKSSFTAFVFLTVTLLNTKSFAGTVTVNDQNQAIYKGGLISVCYSDPANPNGKVDIPISPSANPNDTNADLLVIFLDANGYGCGRWQVPQGATWVVACIFDPGATTGATPVQRIGIIDTD